MLRQIHLQCLDATQIPSGSSKSHQWSSRRKKDKFTVLDVRAECRSRISQNPAQGGTGNVGEFPIGKGEMVPFFNWIFIRCAAFLPGKLLDLWLQLHSTKILPEQEESLPSPPLADEIHFLFTGKVKHFLKVRVSEVTLRNQSCQWPWAGSPGDLGVCSPFLGLFHQSGMMGPTSLLLLTRAFSIYLSWNWGKHTTMLQSPQKYNIKQLRHWWMPGMSHGGTLPFHDSMIMREILFFSWFAHKITFLHFLEVQFKKKINCHGVKAPGK